MSVIQFAEKLKDILFFLMKQFHGNHAIVISSIPSIDIITPHLTLLTSYRLVAISPQNNNFTRLLHKNSAKTRIFVDIMTRNINAL